MSTQYTPIGIDHGTTNSALAVMEGDRPRIVRYNGVDETMASAVYMTKRGRTFIGPAAIKAMSDDAPDEGNGYTGYKLRMGQDDRYEFAAAQKVLTPPQMGALVIGELLGEYRKYSEGAYDPKVAVITRPAKFTQAAIDATREAARLAGLLHYPLLQEPIAAALAYSFDSSDQRAHWLVFDLGGGTLDVSLVAVRNGKPIVPEAGNAGDDQLGGRKFDRELMAYVVGELRKQYALAGLSERNKSYQHAWARLALAVEEAKIKLSTQDETRVMLPHGILCLDEAGREVEVSVPVRRVDYEKLIATDVERAIQICKGLVAANRLTPRDIDRMILVGGPTKTPYVKQQLQERLGIKLDTRIDPMTAVALGAALHAATLVLPDAVREQLGGRVSSSGGTKLRLEYEPRSNAPSYMIAGSVEAPDPASLYVEVVRTDGLWSSGRVPVGDDGVFTVDVLLVDRGAPHQSTFRTTVFDQTGKPRVSADEPKIWYPFPDIVPRLASSLAVAVKGNQVEVLIRAGTSLDAKGQGKFRTLTALRKGSSADVLEIAVVEGVTHLFGEEGSSADSHLHVGTLRIKGDDAKITSDLPIGAEIEVKLFQDRSHEIRALAVVPLLDDEFEAIFQGEPFKVDLEALNERFTQLLHALDSVREVHRDKPLPEVAERLEILERLKVADSIRTDLDRAEDEVDSAYRAHKRMLSLTGSVHDLQRRQQRVRLEREIQSLRGVVKGDEVQDLDAIEQELRDSGAARLADIEHTVSALEFKVRTRPHFELLLDLEALSGLRVSTEQHALFTRAQQLLDRIDAKGGVRFATESDLREMQSAHDDLARAHDDLNQRRQQVLEKWKLEPPRRDLGRDVERA